MNLHDINIIVKHWTTSTGLVIPVTELTNRHIENILNIFFDPNARTLSTTRRVQVQAVHREAQRRHLLTGEND